MEQHEAAIASPDERRDAARGPITGRHPITRKCFNSLAQSDNEFVLEHSCARPLTVLALWDEFNSESESVALSSKC